MSASRKWRGRVACLCVLAVSTGGCSFGGLNDVALPGGPALGSHPLHVTVDLTDAANLARQASVKVDNVTVGSVDSILLSGWTARTQVVIADGVHLPANAVAAVRQTGLLGEKYLELSAPAGVAPVGTLTDGAHLTADRSTRGVDVDEVLGALSLLLNGGGLDHLRTIVVELHHALDGHSGDVRQLLSEFDQFTQTLADNRQSIVTALSSLDQLTARLAQGQQAIATAIDTIGPAVKALADQRPQIDRLLQSSTRLAAIGGQTIQATQSDLVANLNALEPTLARLAQTGDQLPQSLEFLLSFPFPNEILTAIHGDYVNANIQIDANLSLLAQMLQKSSTGATP